MRRILCGGVHGEVRFMEQIAATVGPLSRSDALFGKRHIVPSLVNRGLEDRPQRAGDFVDPIGQPILRGRLTGYH